MHPLTANCRILFAWTTLLACTPGCAGYRWGQQTLYRPDIQSVHVPIFESTSFRPGLGELLTEAVVKEIQTRTPYHIASAETADSVLQGTLVTESKRVVAEDRFDVPRIIEADMVVEVTWKGRQGDLLGQAMVIPVEDFRLRAGQGNQFIPEGGQSLASTHQRMIEQLASQIVSQMELPPY